MTSLCVSMLCLYHYLFCTLLYMLHTHVYMVWMESRLWNAAWFRRCACIYWSSRLFLVIACAVFLSTDVGRGFARFCLPLSIVHGVRVTLTLIPLLFRLEVGPSSLHPLVCSAWVCSFLFASFHDVRETLTLIQWLFWLSWPACSAIAVVFHVGLCCTSVSGIIWLALRLPFGGFVWCAL